MRYKELLIVVLLLAVALVRAGAADNGGTGAFFSDTATSAGNVFTAGTWNITATVDFHPDTLNLKSEGRFVTVYIELPEGFYVEDIEVDTILLNDKVPALLEPTEIGDYDGDGIPDLMVKFDRAAVQDVLVVGEQVEITITGKVAGTFFEGIDIIRVIDPRGEDIVAGNWTAEETIGGDNDTIAGHVDGDSSPSAQNDIEGMVQDDGCGESDTGGDDGTTDNVSGNKTSEESEAGEADSTTENVQDDLSSQEAELGKDDSTAGDAGDNCSRDEDELDQVDNDVDNVADSCMSEESAASPE